MLLPKPIIEIKHQNLRIAKNMCKYIYDSDRALNETLEDKLLGNPQFSIESQSINV